MADEWYETLKKLQSLTKANLAKQFENVRDFCESSINFANRCDIHLALKDLIYAEIAAHRLREDAERRYADGLITKDEHIEIVDLSYSLIFDEVSEAVTNAVVKSCECSKGAVKL